jgi:spermidine/putrescine transport system permease protein
VADTTQRGGPGLPAEHAGSGPQRGASRGRPPAARRGLAACLPAALARSALVVPSVVLLLGLILAPLLALGIFSLYQQIHPLTGFGAFQYRQLFTGGLYLSVLFKTLYVALLVTAVTAAIAWPAGWIVSRLPRRGQITVLTIVIVPYLTSFLLLIYAMFVLLAPSGPLMTLLGAVGIASKHSSIVYTPWATIVMLVYESIPIMLLVMYAASERIPNELVDAARSLGAGNWRVFRRVIFPISLPGAISGAALVFIPALGAFAEPEILGGPNGLLFGNLVNDQINTTGDEPFAAALSFLLLATVIVVVLFLVIALRFARSGPRALAGLAGRTGRERLAPVGAGPSR